MTSSYHICRELILKEKPLVDNSAILYSSRSFKSWRQIIFEQPMQLKSCITALRRFPGQPPLVRKFIQKFKILKASSGTTNQILQKLGYSKLFSSSDSFDFPLDFNLSNCWHNFPILAEFDAF